MDYVQSHTPEEIAEIIKPQFKDADMETITTIVKRYAEQETWKENLVFEKQSFELLQDILESADELEKRVPYKDLVTTEFAKKAQKQLYIFYGKEEKAKGKSDKTAYPKSWLFQFIRNSKKVCRKKCNHYTE